MTIKSGVLPLRALRAVSPVRFLPVMIPLLNLTFFRQELSFYNCSGKMLKATNVRHDVCRFPKQEEIGVLYMAQNIEIKENEDVRELVRSRTWSLSSFSSSLSSSTCPLSPSVGSSSDVNDARQSFNAAGST